MPSSPILAAYCSELAVPVIVMSFTVVHTYPRHVTSQGNLIVVLGTVQDIEHTCFRSPLPLAQNRAKCKTSEYLLVGLARIIWLGNVLEDALVWWWLVDNLSCLQWCPLVPVMIISRVSAVAEPLHAYLLTHTLMANKTLVTANTFQPIFLRSSISGSAVQFKNSTTSLAICEVEALVPSSYSTRSS